MALDADGTLWRFCLLIAKADAEQRTVGWGLTSYGASDEVCPKLLANRTARPFSDLLASAAWRASEPLPEVTYLARIREPWHPLWRSPFAARWFAMPDLMHMMDCKGVSATVFGSLLHFLLRDPAFGDDHRETSSNCQRSQACVVRSESRASQTAGDLHAQHCSGPLGGTAWSSR